MGCKVVERYGEFKVVVEYWRCCSEVQEMWREAEQRAKGSGRGHASSPAIHLGYFATASNERQSLHSAAPSPTQALPITLPAAQLAFSPSPSIHLQRFRAIRRTLTRPSAPSHSSLLPTTRARQDLNPRRPQIPPIAESRRCQTLDCLKVTRLGVKCYAPSDLDGCRRRGPAGTLSQQSGRGRVWYAELESDPERWRTAQRRRAGDN